MLRYVHRHIVQRLLAYRDRRKVVYVKLFGLSAGADNCLDLVRFQLRVGDAGLMRPVVGQH